MNRKKQGDKALAFAGTLGYLVSSLTGVIVLEGYSYSNSADSEEFHGVAEMYFNNYLLQWCNTHHIDDETRRQMIGVLTDYSHFLFDSLMHQWSEEDRNQDDLKN